MTFFSSMARPPAPIISLPSRKLTAHWWLFDFVSIQYFLKLFGHCCSLGFIRESRLPSPPVINLHKSTLFEFIITHDRFLINVPIYVVHWLGCSRAPWMNLNLMRTVRITTAGVRVWILATFIRYEQVVCATDSACHAASCNIRHSNRN